MSENVLENPEKIWKIRLPLRILLITFSYCVGVFYPFFGRSGLIFGLILTDSFFTIVS